MQLPSITSKQLQIVKLIYRFRFLNTHHVQKILGHKDPRRIKAWLLDLTQKGFIRRIYSKEMGEHMKPAVYFLDKKGRALLLKQNGINKTLLTRVYREHSVSPVFIDHNILVTDIYGHLIDLVNHHKAKLHFYTETDLYEINYLLRPLPDIYFAVEEKNTMKRYFLEIIDEDTPPFAIQERIERYIEYYDSERWQKHTQHPFPTIFLVCPDEKTKKSLNKFISEKIEEEAIDINFYLTIHRTIRLHGIKNGTWEKVNIE